MTAETYEQEMARIEANRWFRSFKYIRMIMLYAGIEASVTLRTERGFASTREFGPDLWGVGKDLWCAMMEIDHDASMLLNESEPGAKLWLRLNIGALVFEKGVEATGVVEHNAKTLNVLAEVMLHTLCHYMTRPFVVESTPSPKE